MFDNADDEVSVKRCYLWTKSEKTGFPARANHALMSCSLNGHRYIYAFGGFRGYGTVFLRYNMKCGTN